MHRSVSFQRGAQLAPRVHQAGLHRARRNVESDGHFGRCSIPRDGTGRSRRADRPAGPPSPGDPFVVEPQRPTHRTRSQRLPHRSRRGSCRSRRPGRSSWRSAARRSGNAQAGNARRRAAATGRVTISTPPAWTASRALSTSPPSSRQAWPAASAASAAPAARRLGIAGRIAASRYSSSSRGALTGTVSPAPVSTSSARPGHSVNPSAKKFALPVAGTQRYLHGRHAPRRRTEAPALARAPSRHARGRHAGRRVLRRSPRGVERGRARHRSPRCSTSRTSTSWPGRIGTARAAGALRGPMMEALQRLDYHPGRRDERAAAARPRRRASR